MYVVMAAPECAPVAKVGGLADVVHGLSRELQAQGCQVEVILPMYDCMRYDHIEGLERCYDELWVPLHEQWLHCEVHSGRVDGLDCLFIKPLSEHRLFDRGVYYGHDDDAVRFGFFARAVLEFLYKSGRRPQIIHCHDWQTGLIPVLLYAMYQGMGMDGIRACYTLHNVRHQGLTDPRILAQVGLDPAQFMLPDRLADDTHPGAANLMKGGIVFANFVTTVSPRYAEEIRLSELGHGLQATLNRHQGKFGGVLNGIDYASWDPQTDRFLAARYSEDALAGKFVNRSALRQRLLLRESFKPVIAVVSRLDPQKGVELISHAIFYALANRAQFVLLGAGSSAQINDHFLGLKAELNDNPDCHLEIGYDEELAHLIYAGADMLVIPSAFEPCGLTQLIAMHYGTVPVVRATGGLADTVFDANYAERPYEERTGYTFQDFDISGLESAMGRAIGLWYRYPRYFQQLRQNGMRQDYAWRRSGADYLNIYRHIQA